VALPPTEILPPTKSPSLKNHLKKIRHLLSVVCRPSSVVCLPPPGGQIPHLKIPALFRAMWHCHIVKIYGFQNPTNDIGAMWHCHLLKFFPRRNRHHPKNDLVILRLSKDLTPKPYPLSTLLT
jgi:hypothetical protein